LTRGNGATSESNWTDWQKAFNGRLFRPDLAPNESGAEDSEPGNLEQSAPPESPSTAGNPAPAAQAGAKMKITNPLFESSPTRKH